MKLNFPEPKTDFTEWPTTDENEPANDLLSTEGLTSFTEWQADAQEAALQKEAERKAAKEKKAMQFDAREKRERAERYVLLKMGRQLQDNIIAAGRITETVMKAARDGRPPQEIALLAVKGLSLLVNDPMVYTAIAREYREKYNIELEPKPPYNLIRKDAGEK